MIKSSQDLLTPHLLTIEVCSLYDLWYFIPLQIIITQQEDQGKMDCGEALVFRGENIIHKITSHSIAWKELQRMNKFLWKSPHFIFSWFKLSKYWFVCRPRENQGLLYKDCCPSIIILSHTLTLFLSCVLGATKPKRINIIQRVIKYNMWHRLRTF